MPHLTREQAAEQMNRLFPHFSWAAGDMGLYSVSFPSPVGRPVELRMWLPMQSPEIEDIARYRLNLDDRAELTIIPIGSPSGTDEASRTPNSKR